MLTIRGLIREIQAEMRGADLLPDRASDLLNQLTSLLGNVLDELRVAELAYKHVKLAMMNLHEHANRATIEAECSPEFARWREARDVEQLTIEMIRSLKTFLKSKTEEMRLSR